MTLSSDVITDDVRVMILKRDILDLLPWGSHEVLRVLFGLLVKIVLNCEKNKMTLQNLITCMVPSLRCIPGVMLYAVQYYDYCFAESWVDGEAEWVEGGDGADPYYDDDGAGGHQHPEEAIFGDMIDEDADVEISPDLKRDLSSISISALADTYS
eukprot:TRINITY_DN6352_c1_g1_i2.p1 TRINITY_DN6352_c1_g1~~TRINITY_DN6352_c1_g1_i2.p1  ORF type:complete len:155 (+),score=32.55 TRINITY_DN6352_c1_g1_i2:258-722(+)